MIIVAYIWTGLIVWTLFSLPFMFDSFSPKMNWWRAYLFSAIMILVMAFTVYCFYLVSIGFLR